LTLTNQNIEALLVLCQKKNQLAQLEVYRRYQYAMFNTAMRIVKDTAEAEDVLQESFLTAFTKLDTFKGDATFGSWLKRIVTNNSIVQYRKNVRFSNVPVEEIPDDIDEETVSIASDDYSQTKVNEVLNCLNKLKDNYQQVLSLHLIEGYDYEEICDIMQISYANCRTMISRAKESLRKNLQHA